MILVDIVLHGAQTGRVRRLGRVKIANDGTGGARRGNYVVVAWNGRSRRPRGGYVEGFPRRSRSALELVRRALNDLSAKGRLP